jgi:hypothetical protein
LNNIVSSGATVSVEDFTRESLAEEDCEIRTFELGDFAPGRGEVELAAFTDDGFVTTGSFDFMVNDLYTGAFAIGAILYCLALLPTALSTAQHPQPLKTARLDIRRLYRNSPVAVIACVLIGMVNGAFGTLAQLSADSIIDNVLGSGTKSGYTFAATPDSTSPALQFTAEGTPQVSTGATQTGARFYFSNESQVVRFNLGGAATSGSTAIGN